MTWTAILWIVGFIFLIRIMAVYLSDYEKQWLTLAGKDEKILDTIAERLNAGRDGAWLLHDETISDDGWLHVPVLVMFPPFYFPVVRFIPFSLMWLILNIKYKVKFKGRGFLWQVPRTRVINEMMQRV